MSIFAQRTLRPANRRRQSLISLTPLIDVVFILLVFFMLASSLVEWRAIVLDPPAPAGASAGALQNALIIDVRPGDYRLSGQVLTLPDLLARVGAVLSRRGDDLSVVVRAAPGVDLQRSVRVLDGLAAAGVTRISLRKGGSAR